MSYTNAKIDKFALILYLLLGFIGGVVLFRYSQTNNLASIQKQVIVFFPMSLFIVMCFVKRGNVEIFRKHENIHYIIAIILLSLVLIVGSEILGAKRSLNLYLFSFQPSYYARIILINSLAIYLSKYGNLIADNKIVEFAKKSPKLIIFFLITTFLILKEPHLSVLLITGASMFFLIFLAGLNKKIILVIILFIALAFTGLVAFGESYRGARMKVYGKYLLVNPYRHKIKVTGDNERQIKESLGALSAGGMWGTKSDFGSAERKFVPEANTDYIFSFIGEEFGFVFSSLLLLVFFALFFRLFMLSMKVKDPYRRYFALGLCMNFILTVIVNTGVATSILPSTGVSLPFISYGGSAYLMESLSIAIILNIIAQEKRIEI